VNLEAKLISALEELDRLREKNRKKKEQLQKYEEDHDLKETEKTLVILKTQLEEAKRIKVVRSQLKEKEENCKLVLILW
jgi:hypothetical protein